MIRSHRILITVPYDRLAGYADSDKRVRRYSGNGVRRCDMIAEKGTSQMFPFHDRLIETIQFVDRTAVLTKRLQNRITIRILEGKEQILMKDLKNIIDTFKSVHGKLEIQIVLFFRELVDVERKAHIIKPSFFCCDEMYHNGPDRIHQPPQAE